MNAQSQKTQPPANTLTSTEYGVGARVTLAVYDSDFVRIITEAIAGSDASGLEVTTTDISTCLLGDEQAIVRFLRDLGAAAAASGAHCSLTILLSRGCPGELACALPSGVTAIGAAPVSLPPSGIRARAHWSLYPLLDAGDPAQGNVAHMEPIYRAIEDAKSSGVYSGSDHFATRLDGDLSAVLETAANAWISVGATVQHVVTHLTISLNSPSQIDD